METMNQEETKAAHQTLRHPFDLFRQERLVLLLSGLAFLGLRGGAYYHSACSTRPVAEATGRFACRLDINRATALELQELAGIGESRAQKLVDFRERHGPFQSLEDLKKALPEQVVKKILPHVVVGGPFPSGP